MKHPITIQETPKRRAIYPILSKCAIDEGTGYIELCFHADLKPHFLQMKKNFTTFDLAEFWTLQSIYSQCMFEILKSYSNLDYIELPLDELYEIMGFPEALQSNFNHFRKKVLEQAYKEIVEAGLSLQYEWKPVKSGRGGKVSMIRFIFSGAPKPVDDEKVIQAKLHKQASTCYLRLLNRGVICTPKAEKSPKCAICVTQPWNVNRHDKKTKYSAPCLGVSPNLP